MVISAVAVKSPSASKVSVLFEIEEMGDRIKILPDPPPEAPFVTMVISFDMSAVSISKGLMAVSAKSGKKASFIAPNSPETNPCSN